MAYVDPKIGSIVAHQAGVITAVRGDRDRIFDIAKGLFASHDKPGRHEFHTHDDGTDALIDFDGPAPLAVEYGHWTPDHKEHVEGLHIFDRAIAQAAR